MSLLFGCAVAILGINQTVEVIDSMNSSGWFVVDEIGSVSGMVNAFCEHLGEGMSIIMAEYDKVGAILARLANREGG